MRPRLFPGLFLLALATAALADPAAVRAATPYPKTDEAALAASRPSPRERVSLNAGWRFKKYDAGWRGDDLIYDLRPEVRDEKDDRPADAQPTEAARVAAGRSVLKPWILPTANAFIRDPARRHVRPPGMPGAEFAYVQNDYDDSRWERVDLPHDWAIKGPFLTGPGDDGVGGGMGRLPSPGIAWYRKELEIPAADAGKSLFLEIDGAMAYAMVWLNGRLVGGWPYGYTSWQVDLTPYAVPGGRNQLAIRLDNPAWSSRWYPGGGIYRNVWLTKTQPVRIAHWGTCLTTPQVSAASATIDLAVTLENASGSEATVGVTTALFALDAAGRRSGRPVASFAPLDALLTAGASTRVSASLALAKPRLWGPPPTQAPRLYLAVTTLWRDGLAIDRLETRFGVRELRFDPAQGILVNGERIRIQGVNQHHDLGALGAAFNLRAARRQLETLRELGCNAVRMAHNPPAPELLELTDRMGFLVVDEIFDAWERKKPALDFHLVFPDWHEADLRAMIRRDRNCPSVILWSVGNEVGEQYTGEPGAAVGRRLHDIARDEDPTRPVTISMNFAKPDMPLPAVFDLVSLNYQGEGIRDTPAHAELKGIRTPPQYSAFHEKFPDKVILSSETAAALSTRGEYLFPVTSARSAPVRDGLGGDSKSARVSAYELHAADFGSTADKVFSAQDKHPFVAGEFVWSGWDYLGEPTPYYSARSSNFGIIDLAGFKKDRFYLYQSRWRPELPLAHILPHWTWPERVGQVTPVHVFTSGDEAELFLNGRSLGRKKKGADDHRLRWDEVVYEPGKLRVVAYKGGRKWAEEQVETTGPAAGLTASPDRAKIRADGRDLSFVTVRVVDAKGRVCPRAKDALRFEIEGPGEIVATDNGDPADFEPFPSPARKAFNGLCLVIVRAKPGQAGLIRLKATGDGLAAASVRIRTADGPVSGSGL